MISVRLIQMLLALPLLALGATCIVAPDVVEPAMVRPGAVHASSTTAMMVSAFGAQSILTGLVVAFARFTPATFVAYAVGIGPFLWFAPWFLIGRPVLQVWVWLDVLVNLATIVLCWLGHRAARLENVDPRH